MGHCKNLKTRNYIMKHIEMTLALLKPKVTNGSLRIRTVAKDHAVIASSRKGMSLTGAEAATKSNSISCGKSWPSPRSEVRVLPTFTYHLSLATPLNRGKSSLKSSESFLGPVVSNLSVNWDSLSLLHHEESKREQHRHLTRSNVDSKTSNSLPTRSIHSPRHFAFLSARVAKLQAELVSPVAVSVWSLFWSMLQCKIKSG